MLFDICSIVASGERISVFDRLYDVVMVGRDAALTPSLSLHIEFPSSRRVHVV